LGIFTLDPIAEVDGYCASSLACSAVSPFVARPDCIGKDACLGVVSISTAIGSFLGACSNTNVQNFICTQKAYRVE
jgi:hypothetical protein